VMGFFFTSSFLVFLFTVVCWFAHACGWLGMHSAGVC
jgi:hypothetical protein